MPEAVAAAIEWVATAAGTEMTLTAAEIAFASKGLVVVGSMLYGQAAKRSAARKQRAQYNANLESKLATNISTEAPLVYTYGQNKVGSNIVAMFTSGDKDQYRHLVATFASHQVESIDEIYVNSKLVGTLDGDGYVTQDGDSITEIFRGNVVTYKLPVGYGSLVAKAGTDGITYPTTLVLGTHYTITSNILTLLPPYTDITDFIQLTYAPNAFLEGKTLSKYEAFTSGTVTIAASYSNLMVYAGIPAEATLVSDYSITGTTLTLTGPYAGMPGNVSYNYSSSKSMLRIQKHYGTPTDPADAYLISTVPGKWTSNHVLRDHAYLVLTLDLNHQDFQSGPPNIQVVLKGKKIYDPRKDSTQGGSGSHRYTDSTTWEYSDNPSLVALDYITSRMVGMPYASLVPVFSDYAEAASVCDATITIDGANAKKYTFNGTITSDEPAMDILENIADSMAGSINGVDWSIYAGEYAAPSVSLNHLDDVVGSLGVAPGLDKAEVFNTVRGRYMGPETKFAPTDFKPFVNTTYKTADGEELAQDLTFPYTTSQQRIHNLATIRMEDVRNGLTVSGDFSYKAWRLRPGDRVLFNSPSELLGMTNKVFRVTDKSFRFGEPIKLTLKEDDASIWDTAPATVVDATMNSGMPSPYSVPTVTGLTAVSGTSTNYVDDAGNLVLRMKISWNAANYRAATGYEIQYRLHTVSQYENLYALPDETSVFSGPAITGIGYTIRIRVVNTFLNVFGNWSYIDHGVDGSSPIPANYSSFSVTFRPNGTRVLNFGFSGSQPPEIAGAMFAYKAAPAGPEVWADMTAFNTSPITESPYEFVGLSAGVYKFAVRSVSRVGTLASAASTLYHTVTVPALQANSSGLLVNRPTNNTVNSTYYATDTKVLYVCTTAPNTWLDMSTNRTSGRGLLSARPTTNIAGDTYFATDTNLEYTCSVAPSTWVVSSSVGAPTGTYVGNTLAQTVELNASTALTDATSAISAANAAASSATAANNAIADIASDSKFTPVEKTAIRAEWDTAYSENAGIEASAATYSVSSTAYHNSLTALGTYLNAGFGYTIGATPPSWINDSSLSTTTDITGSTFRSTWASFYTARQALLNAIAAAAKTLADGAQTAANGAQATANTAVSNAGAAQSTANSALANATAANSAITNMASDSILSPVEKPQAVLEYTAITNEQAGIDTQATNYSISTEKTAYDNAVAALTSYLAGLTGWNTIPGSDVTIVGTTFRSKFSDVYSTRQTLLNAIAAKAKTIADAAALTAAWGSISSRPGELTDGRIATAINSAGTIVSGVKPGIVVTTGSTAGLYMGSDYLGYYNGSAWKTYMDNSGNFYLGGSSGGALSWNGTNLTINGGGTFTGTLSAATGNFGAVTINSTGVGGSLSSGATSYTAGSGIWMAYNSGTPQLRIGTTTNYMRWTGSALEISGGVVDGTTTIGGTTASTVVSGAAAGATAVQPAAIANKLEAGTSYVLTGVVTPTDSGAIKTGSITWNTTTGALTGGTGVAITENGIIAAIGGVSKVAILADGTATFAGALSAATGSFAGSLSAATGSFAGSLSAATGSFTGSLAVGSGDAILKVDSSGNLWSGNAAQASAPFSVTNAGALTVTGGLIRTAASGARVELNSTSNTLKVYTGTGAVNTVTIGGTSAGYISTITSEGGLPGIYATTASSVIEAIYGASSTAAPSIRGYSSSSGYGVSGYSNSNYGIYGTSASNEGVRGQTTVAGGNSHGVRGVNTNGAGTATNTAGFIGGANGYDFYADGAGTNYGPFTGTHDALVSKDETFEIGDIVVDTSIVRRNGVSSTLALVTNSTSVGQKAAIGVVCSMPRTLSNSIVSVYREGFDASGNPISNPSQNTDALLYDIIAINAVGEGQINVCGEGGDFETGDLITTSSMTGKGMKQSDDIIRSKTVAKIREAVTFSSPSEVKMVACIYLCG